MSSFKNHTKQLQLVFSSDLNLCLPFVFCATILLFLLWFFLLPVSETPLPSSALWKGEGWRWGGARGFCGRGRGLDRVPRGSVANWPALTSTRLPFYTALEKLPLFAALRALLPTGASSHGKGPKARAPAPWGRRPRCPWLHKPGLLSAPRRWHERPCPPSGARLCSFLLWAALLTTRGGLHRQPSLNHWVCVSRCRTIPPGCGFLCIFFLWFSGQ